jgi:hypothetical protein
MFRKNDMPISLKRRPSGDSSVIAMGIKIKIKRGNLKREPICGLQGLIENYPPLKLIVSLPIF